VWGRTTKGKHLCASIAGYPMFQKTNLMGIEIEMAPSTRKQKNLWANLSIN
jgi:hypothetical protein